MADQVELRASQLGHARMLALKFLHVVFAEAAQAKRVSLANHVGRKLFGDGDKTDVRTLASRARSGTLDAFFHLF
jgi:hypothetical protein